DQVFEQLGAKPEPQRPAASPAAHSAATVAPTSVPAEESKEGDHERIQRFTLFPAEAPLSIRSQGVAKDRVILITDDERGVAQALADDLRGAGHAVALVR